MKKPFLVMTLMMVSAVLMATTLQLTKQSELRRSMESLSVEVTTPGTLGDVILNSVESYNDVKELTVRGNLNDNDVTVLMLLKSIVSLDIEKTNVTAIPNEFMLRRSSLEKMVFPEVLETIGYRAFYGCQNLKEFSFPSTLKQIGEASFYGCMMPDTLIIPESVTSIGYTAFYGGGFYDENDNYVSATSNLKEVRILGTISFSSWAFESNRNLETVYFADGTTSVSYGLFSSCTNLTKVRLPQTLREIGSSVFNYCTSLIEIDIPEGVTSIGEGAFGYCSSLNNIVLPSTLSSVNRSFKGCAELTNMTIKAIVPPATSDYNIMGGIESQCTLTVPNISLNNYKAARYWNNFNITGAEFLPDRINVNNDYTLAWGSGATENWHPDMSVTRSYAENYYWSNSNVTYGALTIEENSNVSFSSFSMLWDRFLKSNDFSLNPQNTTLISNSSGIKSDRVSITIPLYSGQWHFMVLPFDFKVSEIIKKDDVPYAIRKYSGSNRATGNFENTWLNLTAEDVVKAGEGFIIQCAYDYSDNFDNWNERYYNEFTFKAVGSNSQNDIFVSDDVNVPLSRYESEFAHNRSWNFIGNPYPCYYNIKGMQTTAPITVWNIRDWKYDVYSPQDDEYVLQPGEGFFVQCPGLEEGIVFCKEYRMLHYDDEVAVSRNHAASTQLRNVFNLSLKGDNGQDRTRFVINPSASRSYEVGCDASKFEDMAHPSVQLYTIENNVRYAINERPLDDGEVKIGIELLDAGTYTLSLSTTSDCEFYLIDNETGKEARLDSDDYTFTASEGKFDNRFKIRLELGETTGIRVIDNSRQKNTTYYDLQGRPVSDIKKGLYIRDGKKVVVK